MTPQRKLFILLLTGFGLASIACGWLLNGLAVMDLGAHGASRAVHEVIKDHAQQDELSLNPDQAADPNAYLDLTIDVSRAHKAELRHARRLTAPLFFAGAALVVAAAIVAIRTPPAMRGNAPANLLAPEER
jgi:hypothetical protein